MNEPPARASRLILQVPQTREDLPVRRSVHAKPRADGARLRPAETGSSPFRHRAVVGSVGFPAARNASTSATRSFSASFSGSIVNAKRALFERVLVAAIDIAYRRAGAAIFESEFHIICGSPSKISPAAERKQRVAGEHDAVVREVIADVPEGMPWCFDDLDRVAGEIEFARCRDAARQTGNAFGFRLWARDARAVERLELTQFPQCDRCDGA